MIKRSGIFKIFYNIYPVFCILASCIKSNSRKILVRFRCIYICSINRWLIKSDLSNPATEIRLIYMIIIIGVFYFCIYNVMTSDICIIIRNIKYALLSECLSPAVLADKGAVTLYIHRKIFFWIIIVPADDHNLMVRLFRSHITIGMFIFIIKF